SRRHTDRVLDRAAEGHEQRSLADGPGRDERHAAHRYADQLRIPTRLATALAGTFPPRRRIANELRSGEPASLHRSSRGSRGWNPPPKLPHGLGTSGNLAPHMGTPTARIQPCRRPQPPEASAESLSGPIGLRKHRVQTETMTRLGGWMTLRRRLR